MDLNIECPICEERLCISRSNAKRNIECPSCSHSFDITTAVQVDPQPPVLPARPQKSTAGLAGNARFRTDGSVPPSKPELVKSPAVSKASKSKSPNAGSSSGGDASSAPVVNANELPAIRTKLYGKKKKAAASKNKSKKKKKQFAVESMAAVAELTTDQSKKKAPAAGKVTTESMSGVESIRKEREQRNRKNFITTVVIGLGLLLVIGALVTMLILQLKKVDQLADEPSPTIPGPVEKVEPKIERPDEDLPDSKLVTAPADKPTRKFKLKFDDLPPQKFAYLKKREVNDAWSVIQPYLVNLKVHDARGSHLAVGTIVDTRGWILTSYQTVAGASKIEVTQSAKSIDEVSDDLLTDQVRGVIGVDKKNDLALLSINRRFVISFADVAFADSNTVVETGYFVQCAPPTATNPYARHEAKISVRGGVGDLSDDAQSKAIQAKLGKPVAILGGGDTDEEDNGIDDWPLTWVVASSPKQPLPGTPLVNIDGELAAMNVFSDSREAQYLLVDNVFELIANSADKVQPISVLGGITSDSILVAVPDDHEFREPSVGLNQAGEACKEFNWIPDSQQQYETLQKFAKHFAELKKVSIENLESDDQVDQIISKQVTAWENSLTKRFVEIIESSSNEGDRKKLQEMNRRFATPAIESGGQMVPFFGQVDSAGIIGERMILNLYGDDTSVSVPFVERESPMRLESEWLIFVTTPATPKRVVFTAPNGQKIACFTVFDMLNFGLDL